MSKLKDLTGKRFNLLTATDERKSEAGQVKWLCDCDCGARVWVASHNLLGGASKSCGCVKVSKSGEVVKLHRMTGTAEHQTWKGMRQRCNNPNNARYDSYGGRGIKLCDRWNDFSNFLEDMGQRPEWGTIERKDVDGNYEPSNCKWATLEEQANNKRDSRFLEYKGEMKTSAQWEKQTGIKSATIRARIRKGWSVKDALSKGLTDNTVEGLVKGVTICKTTGRYRAAISHNSKTINLGRYEHLEDAVKARKSAESKLKLGESLRG